MELLDNALMVKSEEHQMLVARSSMILLGSSKENNEHDKSVSFVDENIMLLSKSGSASKKDFVENVPIQNFDTELLTMRNINRNSQNNI